MNYPEEPVSVNGKLNPAAADHILASVFESCQQEPNHISLSEIKAQKRHRRVLTALCWLLVVLVVLAVLILPMVFATARVEISWVEGTPPGSPVLQVSAASFVPIDHISARIDDVELKVHEVAEQLYYLYPDRNGKLTLTVTLANRNSTEAEVEVVNVDHTPPHLVSSALVNKELEIWFEDTDSAIDFDSIYALDTQGNTVYPIRCDKGSVSATFAFPDRTLNIFVSDECGNLLQLVLTVEAPSEG